MRRLWIPTLSVTEEGENAMREFMQSDRAPQAMANMMGPGRQPGR